MWPRGIAGRGRVVADNARNRASLLAGDVQDRAGALDAGPVAGVLPLHHAVQLVRPLLSGAWPVAPGLHVAVLLAYSARNRSASVRIPFAPGPKGKRIEVRFPDPTANSYLAFTAMMMAGLDGVQNKIHPGDPADKNLYDLPPEEDAKIPTVCSSLEQALEALSKDREFLTRGGVFSNDFIDAYIELKMEEVTRYRMTTHPVEFDMYYSL